MDSFPCCFIHPSVRVKRLEKIKEFIDKKNLKALEK